MSTNSQGLIESVRSMVREHYERESSPLLLADLGKPLRDQGLWPFPEAEGKSLLQVIEEAQDQELLIVRDKTTPAYVAVTNAASKPVVEAWMDRRSQTAGSVPMLEALPRSVLLAFCVRPEPGQHVFLHKLPPFKYEVRSPEGVDTNQYVQIEDRYRRPLKIFSLTDLTGPDRLDLQTRIATWSKDKNIPIESFYLQGQKKRMNALERLLAAQAVGMAERIMIPADIALILSRHD